MSQTIDDINRLLWLCQEAVLRAQEEDASFLVRLLSRFPEEMKTIAFRLHQAGILEVPEHVPFTIHIHRSGRGEERQAVWDLYVFDPMDLEEYFSETIKIVGYKGADLEWHFGPGIRRRFVKRMKQWVRFLEAESEKLQSSSTAAAAATKTEPRVEKQTPEDLTVEEVCRKMCKQRNGQRTLKTILNLTRNGASQADIVKQNAPRKGFSASNVSEKLKKVRETYPSFLPEEVR